MHHSVELPRGQATGDVLTRSQIADKQLGAWNGVGMAARQIVEDDHRMFRLPQHPAHVRTDVTGATGHQD
jgi:hypothetical protein